MYDDSCCNFSSPRERIKEKMKSSILCYRSTPYVEGSVAVEHLGELKSRSAAPIKEKCKNFIARIGKGGRKHYNSSDFSYDPLSYALNFEDESNRANELPFINFTSRLPATPDRTPAIKSFEATPASIRRELYAYS